MMVITGRVHCPDTPVSCIYLEIWRRMTLLSKDMAAISRAGDRRIMRRDLITTNKWMRPDC